MSKVALAKEAVKFVKSGRGDPQTLLTRLKGGAAQRGLRWRLEIGRKNAV
jgi:hypothetical protein